MEPATASGTKLGRRNQLRQAELAWTGGGVRPNPPTPPPPPPPPPSLRACLITRCIPSFVPRPRFPTAAGNPPAAVGNLGLGTRLLHPSPIYIHEDCKTTFGQTMLYGNNHSFTVVYTPYHNYWQCHAIHGRTQICGLNYVTVPICLKVLHCPVLNTAIQWLLSRYSGTIVQRCVFTYHGALTDSGTQRFVLSLFLVRPVPTGLAYLTIS